MSFILDALKKSEVERQRQSVPGLMDAGPAAPHPRFPAWAVALTALLAVNLTVLVVVLARGGLPGVFGGPTGAEPAAPRAALQPAPTPTPVPAAPSTPGLATPGLAVPAPAATAGAAADAASAPSPDRHFSPMDAAPPVYAPEIPAAELPPPAPRAAAPEAAAARGPAQSAHERDPLLHEDERADQEVLPTISELNLTGEQELPPLHLDVHVYATRPEDRFVYINMHRYREGSTLAEGPILERIRRDGVVLSYRGVRFLLPRQQ